MSITENQIILRTVRQQYEFYCDRTAQGTYVYLSEEAKFCNNAFAAMLGYTSCLEWEQAPGSFTEAFVDPASQEALVSAYQRAKKQFEGSTIDVTWKKKGGGTVDTTVMLVPLPLGDRVAALHFITVK